MLHLLVFASAYIGYKSIIESTDVTARLKQQENTITLELGHINRQLDEQRISQNDYKIALDFLSNLSEKLISGDGEEACRAIAVLGGLRDKTFQGLLANFNNQFKCGEEQEKTLKTMFEISSKSSQKQCTDGRATRTTIENFGSPNEPNQYCSSISEVPNQYLGPWSDGRVSFRTTKVIKGIEIWCNCQPL